jgi:preprotein translocase subunit SecG
MLGSFHRKCLAPAPSSELYPIIMDTFITTIHVITSILLVILVLIQSGKGSDIGSTLGGGGSSQTVFGSSGGANFFTRFTTGAAVVFMLTSITLTMLGSSDRDTIFRSEPAPTLPGAAPLRDDPQDDTTGTMPAETN